MRLSANVLGRGWQLRSLAAQTREVWVQAPLMATFLSSLLVAVTAVTAVMAVIAIKGVRTRTSLNARLMDS